MLVIIAITQRRKSTLERAARYNGRTKLIDDRPNSETMLQPNNVWPANTPPCSWLPRYPGAVPTSLSPLTATSPFPEPFRYTAVPVSRPKAVPGRSPFCRGQRQPSNVSHRREFARRQRFCRAGKLQLEFLRKRKRDFFSYPTYTNA